MVAGSPSPTSRSAFVANVAAQWIAEAGHHIGKLALRDLPAEDLLHLRTGKPAIRGSIEGLATAAGVVIATPVYKAAYSGLLKAWLDVLPQLALAGKVVLPLMTGGSGSHVLAIDYALRPVLQSMAPALVLSGWHFSEKQIPRDARDDFSLAPPAETKLRELCSELLAALG